MSFKVDHLVYVAETLESGCDQMEALFGVRPVIGGRHANWGTHNALLGLKNNAYLEVLAIDPQGTVPGDAQYALGADDGRRPRLVTWAAKGTDLHTLVSEARHENIQLGNVISGSRAKPDGTLLRWSLSDPQHLLCDGVAPFIIDWLDSQHPSESLPCIGELMQLETFHAQPNETQQVLDALNVDSIVSKVKYGKQTSLIAHIRLDSNGQVIQLK